MSLSSQSVLLANAPLKIMPMSVLLLVIILSSVGEGQEKDVRNGQHITFHHQTLRSLDNDRQLEPAREVLLRAMDIVERELMGEGESTFVDWRKELHWEALVNEVVRNPPHIQRLQLMCSRLYGSTIGLEHKALVGLRQPLVRYIQVAKLTQQPVEQKPIRHHVYRLSAQVNNSEDLNRLENATTQQGEDKSVTDRKRETFAQRQAAYPNFVLAIKQEWVAAIIEKVKRQVAETDNETRTIAGASVTGPVKVTGTIKPMLKYDADIPVVEIHFQGSTEAKNSTAVSGPVVSKSNGQGSVQAKSTIAWDGTQLVASPAQVDCKMETTPVSVRVRRNRLIPGTEGGLVDRIVEGVAMREVQQRMPLAERESSELTKRKVSAQMDEKIAKLIDLANGHIEEKLHKPFIRAGLQPKVHLTKWEEFISIGLRQWDDSGMAADTPTDLKLEKGNATLCIHETALTGFTGNLCGGAIWRSDDFSELQAALIGKEQAGLHAEKKQNWAVQFDWEEPISARIEDNQIEFLFHFQAVSYAGEAEICPIMVTAKYQLSPTRTTLHFKRQGDVKVECLDAKDGNQTARAEIEQFLHSRFAEFFTEEFNFQGLNFPQIDPLGLLGVLHVHHVRTQEGWLYLSLHMRDRMAQIFALE